MTTQPSIMTFFHIRKNTTHKSLGYSQKSFYNLKVVLVRNIYKLYSGFAYIITVVFQVGIGFILSITVHFWLILTYQKKILFLSKVDHLNLSSNWWVFFLRKLTMLYHNVFNILCSILTHQFVIISLRTLLST